MTASTIRYAAKAAYQLCLMRGLYTSKNCGAVCYVEMGQRVVSVLDPVSGKLHNVPIRKAWAAL